LWVHVIPISLWSLTIRWSKSSDMLQNLSSQLLPHPATPRIWFRVSSAWVVNRLNYSPTRPPTDLISRLFSLGRNSPASPSLP
jgi:hypothetical protein